MSLSPIYWLGPSNNTSINGTSAHEHPYIFPVYKVYALKDLQLHNVSVCMGFVFIFLWLK
jgi:hypothetical protein